MSDITAQNMEVDTCTSSEYEGLTFEEKIQKYKVLLNNGETPSSGVVIPISVFAAFKSSQIKTTKGELEGNYVNFSIKKSPLCSSTLKIHRNLLEKVIDSKYDKEKREFKEELLWRGKNSGLKQPMFYDTSKFSGNPIPLKDLLFPNMENPKWLKYKKIKFKDGNRLHWSEDNIEIISRAEYTKNNNVVVLDEWTF